MLRLVLLIEGSCLSMSSYVLFDIICHVRTLKLLDISVLLFISFHVKLRFESQETYRPNRIKSTLMSLGDTPGILLACAKVSGSIFLSFCRPSVEIS